jgi:hypothetical protein
MTNNKQNPWGGGNNQTPPELDEVIRRKVNLGLATLNKYFCASLILY